MRKNLASVLRKYYRRKNKRVFFKNGDTLNETSLKMWEVLGFKEIDSGVLSRVIKGERLFTPKQISAFCQVLGLKRKEQNILQQALAQDILKRSGLELDLLSSSGNLDYQSG